MKKGKRTKKINASQVRGLLNSGKTVNAAIAFGLNLPPYLRKTVSLITEAEGPIQ